MIMHTFLVFHITQKWCWEADRLFLYLETFRSLVHDVSTLSLTSAALLAVIILLTVSYRHFPSLKFHSVWRVRLHS